jgi:hypothetical protein
MRTARARKYCQLLERPSTGMELLAPNFLLPAQVRRSLAVTGEKSLCIALLRTAVDDLTSWPRNAGERRHFLLARAWLLGGQAPISFALACAVVGLDPDGVRRALGLTPRGVKGRFDAAHQQGPRDDARRDDLGGRPPRVVAAG